MQLSIEALANHPATHQPFSTQPTKPVNAEVPEKVLSPASLWAAKGIGCFLKREPERKRKSDAALCADVRTALDLRKRHLGIHKGFAPFALQKE